MIDYLSQTMLGQWFRCPEQFRRRWIEEEVIPPGIAARIGTGLHKGNETNLKAKMATGKDEPLSVVQDAARDGYVKACKEGGVFFPPEEIPSAKAQLAEGVDTTVALAGLYHKSLAPSVIPAAIERRITMQDDRLPVPFAGTIDVLTADNWWFDIKSAARKWGQGQADTAVQATLYNELIKEETGKYPERLSFEVFTKIKTPEHQSLVTVRIPEDYDALVARAAVMLRAIHAGIFQPAEAWHWLCSPKWCGYWYTCPFIPAHKKTLPKRSA